MTRRKSYCHGQEFAIGEMGRNVVRFGSQGLSVPVFSLSQLVQSYVDLSCESKMRVQSRVELPEVKISQLRVFYDSESRCHSMKAQHPHQTLC